MGEEGTCAKELNVSWYPGSCLPRLVVGLTKPEYLPLLYVAQESMEMRSSQNSTVDHMHFLHHGSTYLS